LTCSSRFRYNFSASGSEEGISSGILAVIV